MNHRQDCQDDRGDIAQNENDRKTHEKIGSICTFDGYQTFEEKCGKYLTCHPLGGHGGWSRKYLTRRPLAGQRGP
jgi:hypothetical protein